MEYLHLAPAKKQAGKGEQVVGKNALLPLHWQAGLLQGSDVAQKSANSNKQELGGSNDGIWECNNGTGARQQGGWVCNRTLPCSLLQSL